MQGHAEGVEPGKEPTNEQLRDLYDQEEIARFNNIFSAFVTEVEAPNAPSTKSKANESYPSDDCTDAIYQDSENEAHPQRAYNGLAQHIALGFVAPRLPEERYSTPPFTLSRLRMSLERSYLALVPIYRPFFERMLNLVLWTDLRASLLYCTLYWILWWYNLLPSVAVAYLLYSMARRRLLPYPSAEELRRRREAVSEASEFGTQLSAKFGGSSSDVKNVWNLGRTLYHSRKAMHKAEKEAESRDLEGTSDETATDNEAGPRPEQLALALLDGVADIHERVRNILLWRRPMASLRYLLALAGIFILTLLPTQYTIKALFLALGIVFWHLVPIIAALPPSDRKRLPALFGDVPTDAEYAMEIIPQRVEAGFDDMSTSTHLSAADADQSQAKDAVHKFSCQHKSGLGVATLTADSLFFTPAMTSQAKLAIPLTSLKGVKKTGHPQGLVLRWTDEQGPSPDPQEERFFWVKHRDQLFARLVGSEGLHWLRV